MLSQRKKPNLLQKLTRGLTVGSFITGNTVVHGVPILTLGLTKLFKSSHKIDETNVNLANNWISVNNWAIDRILADTKWDIQVDPNLELKQDGRYIMTCNHQSWVDTTVNQYVGRSRMPLTRFFTKWELIFIPVAGQAFKILGFPMMKRHTKSQIAKNPALKHQDIVEARKACEQLLAYPFTLLNYIEGTRFTPEKHKQQKSPYQHLLKPKAGGLALALNILGHQIDALVDMTIVYLDDVPGYGEFWLGEVPRVVVHLRKIDIPEWIFLGNYEEDREFRVKFYQWLSQRWQEKDALITEIKSKHASQSTPL